MADDITIGSKAIKEVQALKDELIAADMAMIKLSQDALQAGKSLSTISTPGGLSKSGADNAKITAELEALKTKYASLHDTIVKKAEQSRLAEIRLQQQREKAFDTFEKNAKKEAELLEKQRNEYNKLQASVNSMTKAYNDLETRKRLGETLNSKEESQLKTLKGLISEYNGVLKSTDSQIGKNQRNVGNYASGYNALGNSINQLTREAPAFANSINTGFMAISNNIPALTDAISDLRKQNALLRAEGKPTQSILMSLAGAFFNWQTAISLGVTLLTIYGGAIVGAITGSKKRKEALEKEKKAIEEKTKAEQDARDAIASVQATEVSRSKILFETAKNLSLSYKQRTAAVKELQERYPDYLGHLTKEQILAGDTAKAEEQLNAALVNRGKALAAQTFLQKNLEKQLSLEIEIDKLAQKELKYNLEASKNGSKIIVYTDAQKQIQEQKAAIERKANSENLFSLRERLSALKNEQSAFLDIYNANAKYLGIVKETNNETKKEDVTPKVKALESSLKSVGNVIAQVNEEIGRLLTDKILADDSQLPAINFQLEQLVKLKNQLEGMPEVDLKIVNTATKSKEAIKQLSEEMRSYLKSFVDEFSSNTGFTETFKILNKEIEGFGENWKVTSVAIAESAQEMYNFINQNSEANFNAEKERLQSQYDVSLKHAGESTEAKKKLEEDFENKKKDIANREGKAKKEQAMFNILIDTAQAFVSALPNYVLAAAVAVAGAAQLALVSAQKVPQFFMGGTHEGGLMMVNDGAGSNYRETIVTPDGKVSQPTGRNVLMNAPKGTEIFTHDQWQAQLNGMLSGNGINWSSPNIQSGISKSDLREVMMDSIASQPKTYTNFSKTGFDQYISKRGNITRMNTNRGNGKGLIF